MKNMAVLGSLLALSGCATGRMIPFHVDSTPPGAQVDVNGMSMGITPTEIKLKCSKRWVGLAVAPGGWEYDNTLYEVAAYPSRDNPGVSQAKRVNPCQIENPPGRLHFDLGLDPVSPRQRVDLNLTQNEKVPSLEDTIRALKRLKEQGLLTESEYQQKVNKAVKDASQ